MIEKETYGEKFQEHLLDQYKIYVELADRVTERRNKANQFYSSLFSILIPLISVGVTKEIISNVLLFVISIFGIFLCIGWYYNIKSYRQLNSGKFKVIHEMEEHLPFDCFKKEWHHLNQGSDASKYLKLTKIEQFIPFVFCLLFLIIMSYSIFVTYYDNYITFVTQYAINLLILFFRKIYELYFNF